MQTVLAKISIKMNRIRKKKLVKDQKQLVQIAKRSNYFTFQKSKKLWNYEEQVTNIAKDVNFYEKYIFKTFY